MDSNRLLKAGAAAGAAYASWKWLDDRHGITHDIEMARRLLPLRKEINELNKNGFNVTELWRKVLSKNPNKPALLYLDEVVTYQQVEDRSNQVSNWLLSKGLKRGDTVALLMENRPEFVISWLGMTKIGVKVALINTMIKQKPLYHCIKISSCKMLFFGAELADQVNDIKEDLVELGVMLFATSKVENVDWCPMVTAEIDASPTTATSPKFRQGIGMQDVFGYIYTSGTTGLPKAAVILHQKMFAFGALMTRSFKVRETDVVYTCLPLFHSAGGGLGIGIMLYTGATVVIKRKFSASDFWTDCIKYKCTVVQYIGELCRYLTLCDERPEETKHCVRLAIGNGLRPEIWGTFQERFNIPEIGEFYGATEGNGALVQHCTKPADRGSVGRVGSLMKKITGIKFAKFDVVEEKPIRGPDGFCIECAADEPGELLFLIRDDDPSSQFAGYNDPKATAKKIITDAFVKGDKYFRTGDLLSRDATGRVYFRDRIGDTFRCKGENVSTSEVAEVLSTFPGVEELNIYGVQIPNQLDGRFPAAAITPKDGNIANLDMKKLLAHAKKNLPAYAIPMFLRIQTEIAVTATLKLQKVQLRKEGMDINIIQDPMYWLHDENQEYVPLTQDDYARIIGQRARL
eukprot:CAMPEP_0171521432 /NCGR_PEP_ID=MMETSP0959-20130129/7118_1 /TAXON_ID=87120 /ORGANISM="Aurantiochytrium limacinum, Strain ATCCMYA-1381" /LENGTH=629 /DNA_ID=CAMNT_0012061311 /DNA_START=71 /DNA_END=1960 /DNA_ORIENTATION=+